MKGKVLAGALAACLAVVAFVVPWESGGEQHLTPYQDIVGVWTVCDGVTGPDVVPGRQYSEAECNALVADAVAKHLRGLAVCIHRPLADNEWVALGSWVYNVGVPTACRSTLVRMVNAGRPAAEWCKQLLRWDYAGGRKVKGLTRRRQAEYQVCIGG